MTTGEGKREKTPPERRVEQGKGLVYPGGHCRRSSDRANFEMGEEVVLGVGG